MRNLISPSLKRGIKIAFVVQLAMQIAILFINWGATFPWEWESLDRFLYLLISILLTAVSIFINHVIRETRT